jgi:hypothetical protein
MKQQDIFEQFIRFFQINPFSSKKDRTVIDDGNKEEVISETLKQTILNDAGMPETILTSKSPVLKDGNSLTETTICQKCRGIVHTESIHRCPCGRTCCVSRGCGIIWGGKWYCSFRCVILKKLRLLRRF